MASLPGRFEAHRRIWWVLLSMIFAAPALLALWASLSAGSDTLLDGWSEWLLALLAAIVAGFELWRFLTRRPELVIDAYGLFWREFGADAVPWSAIERVEMVASGGSDDLMVTLRDTARLPGGGSVTPRRWLRFQGPSRVFMIRPELLDKNLDQIAREIERFHPVPIRWVG